MKGPIKDNIRDYYNSKSLSETQLDRIYSRKKPKAYFLAFGTITAAFLALFFLMTNDNFERKLMEEIVYNHNKNLDAEFLASNLDEIQKKLPRLDFMVANSKIISEQNWEVVGARYCSLAGNIAAQIKLKNKKTGKMATLYQSKLIKQVRKSEASINGANVLLWQEKGLLMGIASP